MPILTNSDYSRILALRARSSKQPIDLTGFDLALCVKGQRGDDQPLLLLTLGSGLTVPAPTNGQVVMNLTAQQTNQIGAGDRVWALYRTDGDCKLCLATGKMFVRQGI